MITLLIKTCRFFDILLHNSLSHSPHTGHFYFLPASGKYYFAALNLLFWLLASHPGSALAGQIKIPVDGGMQLYCACLGGTEQPVTYSTPGKKNYQIWMRLEYLPVAQDESSGVRRMLLLIPTTGKSHTTLRKGILHKLAANLDQVSEGAVGCYEYYQTDKYGLLEKVAIYLFNTSNPVFVISAGKKPDSCQLLISDDKDSAKNIDIRHYRVMPAIGLPLFSYEGSPAAFYEPIHCFEMFQFHYHAVESSRRIPLLAEFQPGCHQLHISGLFNVTLTRKDTGKGLPDRIDIQSEGRHRLTLHFAARSKDKIELPSSTSGIPLPDESLTAHKRVSLPENTPNSTQKNSDPESHGSIKKTGTEHRIAEEFARYIRELDPENEEECIARAVITPEIDTFIQQFADIAKCKIAPAAADYLKKMQTAAKRACSMPEDKYLNECYIQLKRLEKAKVLEKESELRKLLTHISLEIELRLADILSYDEIAADFLSLTTVYYTWSRFLNHHYDMQEKERVLKIASRFLEKNLTRINRSRYSEALIEELNSIEKMLSEPTSSLLETYEDKVKKVRNKFLKIKRAISSTLTGLTDQPGWPEASIMHNIHCLLPRISTEQQQILISSLSSTQRMTDLKMAVQCSKTSSLTTGWRENLQTWTVLLQHTAVANSSLRDTLVDWQQYLIRTLGYSWTPPFENELTGQIIGALTTLSAMPRMVLYGSQIQCGLISCIYRIPHHQIGMTTLDFDFLIEQITEDKLKKILSVIASKIPSVVHELDKSTKEIMHHFNDASIMTTPHETRLILSNTGFAFYVDVRGYKPEERSFRLSVYKVPQKGRSLQLCCIDLTPSEKLPDPSACWKLPVSLNTETTEKFYIEGIAPEEALRRLSLALNIPKTSSEVTTEGNKQMERFIKSRKQLECWLNQERAQPRLGIYSADAPKQLHQLQQSFFPEQEKPVTTTER